MNKEFILKVTDFDHSLHLGSTNADSVSRQFFIHQIFNALLLCGNREKCSGE